MKGKRSAAIKIKMEKYKKTLKEFKVYKTKKGQEGYNENIPGRILEQILKQTD